MHNLSNITGRFKISFLLPIDYIKIRKKNSVAWKWREYTSTRHASRLSRGDGTYKKLRLSRLPPTENIAQNHSHIGARKIYRRCFVHRDLFGSRRYKISPATTTTITIATTTEWALSRAYHYHRRTLGVDKSCDRNDSAKLLLARIRARSLPCWSLHGRKSGTEEQGVGDEEKGGDEEEEGARPSPPLRRRRPATAREAMSVTSGNYARVPVAIGLLILLGACWVRSLLALRLVGSVASSAEWR